MSYFPEIEIKSSLTSKNAFVTPMKELRVAQSIRLCGAAFYGDILDPNFWYDDSDSTTGTATVEEGQMELFTGSGADGYIKVLSKRVGRYISGQANYFRGVVRVPDTGVSNNLRVWGVAGSTESEYDTDDGAGFGLLGSTFILTTTKEGVQNYITTFNGDLGTSYTLDTNVHTYEIWYTNSSVWWFIDDVLLHKYTASTDPWSDTLHFRVMLINHNLSGLSHPIYLYCRVASINRMGHPQGSSPAFYHIPNGVETSKILKYGPGTLHRIVLNQSGAGGATITVYDAINDSDITKAVAVIEASGNPGTLTYGLDFHEGLYIKSESDCGDITVIYE